MSNYSPDAHDLSRLWITRGREGSQNSIFLSRTQPRHWAGGRPSPASQSVCIPGFNSLLPFDLHPGHSIYIRIEVITAPTDIVKATTDDPKPEELPALPRDRRGVASPAMNSFALLARTAPLPRRGEIDQEEE